MQKCRLPYGSPHPTAYARRRCEIYNFPLFIIATVIIIIIICFELKETQPSSSQQNAMRSKSLSQSCTMTFSRCLMRNAHECIPSSLKYLRRSHLKRNIRLSPAFQHLHNKYGKCTHKNILWRPKKKANAFSLLLALRIYLFIGLRRRRRAFRCCYHSERIYCFLSATPFAPAKYKRNREKIPNDRCIASSVNGFQHNYRFAKCTTVDVHEIGLVWKHLLFIEKNHESKLQLTLALLQLLQNNRTIGEFCAHTQGFMWVVACRMSHVAAADNSEIFLFRTEKRRTEFWVNTFMRRICLMLASDGTSICVGKWFWIRVGVCAAETTVPLVRLTFCNTFA